MSQNKISVWEAECIAGKIAAKAFEHLLAPHNAAMQKFARECYDELLHSLGIAAKRDSFIKAGVVKVANNTRINFVHDGDVGEQADRRFRNAVVQGENVLTLMSNVSWVVANSERVASYDALADAAAHLLAKRRALAEELSKQIRGKSVKVLMKTWPEAAEFVASYFSIVDAPMTTPLEELLAKFLPMLPAPQEVRSGA